MADPDRQRERDRFTDNGDRWGVWVGAVAILAFAAVPVWHLIEWLVSLF